MRQHKALTFRLWAAGSWLSRGRCLDLEESADSSGKYLVSVRWLVLSAFAFGYAVCGAGGSDVSLTALLQKLGL